MQSMPPMYYGMPPSGMPGGVPNGFPGFGQFPQQPFQFQSMGFPPNMFP